LRVAACVVRAVLVGVEYVVAFGSAANIAVLSWQLGVQAVCVYAVGLEGDCGVSSSYGEYVASVESEEGGRGWGGRGLGGG